MFNGGIMLYYPYNFELGGYTYPTPPLRDEDHTTWSGSPIDWSTIEMPTYDTVG